MHYFNSGFPRVRFTDTARLWTVSVDLFHWLYNGSELEVYWKFLEDPSAIFLNMLDYILMTIFTTFSFECQYHLITLQKTQGCFDSEHSATLCIFRRSRRNLQADPLFFSQLLGRSTKGQQVSWIMDLCVRENCSQGCVVENNL